MAKQGKLSEAMTLLKRAGPTNGNAGRYYELMGNIAFAQGDLDAGRDAWQRAADGGEARLGLATVALLATEYSRALELPGTGLAERKLKARALLATNAQGNANAALELVAGESQDVEARYLAGTAQFALGNFAAAEATFKSLCESAPLWCEYGLLRTALASSAWPEARNRAVRVEAALAGNNLAAVHADPAMKSARSLVNP